MNLNPTVKLLIVAAALASFAGADILFMHSKFCQFHPNISHLLIHLPLHYINFMFLHKIYHGSFESYRCPSPYVPVLVVHLIKAVVQISASFVFLFLTAVFNEPLSDDIPDGLDVYLLASTAFLILFAMIVSFCLPGVDLGVSLTNSLAGMYVTMLYNISGISFELKVMALVVVLALIVIKNHVEASLLAEGAKMNGHGSGLHPIDRPEAEEEC